MKLKLAVSILLASLMIGATGLPVASAADKPNYYSVIQEMTPRIGQMMQKDQITGAAVALVDGQDVVWQQGFGIADVENYLPVGSDTLFQIGSVSKVFTAVAIMRLVEQGLVDLDHPIQEYIPNFRIKQRFPDSKPITVRAMLTHHSGIPGDYWYGTVTTVPDPDWNNWVIDRLKDDYTTYPVDYYSSYSNVAVSLLKEVIANASGRSFESYTDAMFADLGMPNSSYHSQSAPDGGVAQGYYNGRRVAQNYLNVSTSGSITSTLRDMAQFIRVLNSGGGKALGPESLNQTYTVQNANNPLDLDQRSGLGWDSVSSRDLAYAGRAAMKGGATIAFRAEIVVLPDHGLGAVVLANSATGSAFATSVAKDVVKAALKVKKGMVAPEAAPLPVSTPVTWPMEKLKPLEGFYVGASGVYIVKATQNGLGFGTREGSVALTSLINGRFIFPDTWDMNLEFRKASGKTVVVEIGPQSTAMLAVKYEPPPISAGWRARLGDYVMTNLGENDASPLFPDAISFVKTKVSLGEDGGLLFFSGTSGGNLVIEPVSDTLAFVAGLGRAGGSSLQVVASDKGEQLRFLGGLYRKVK